MAVVAGAKGPSGIIATAGTAGPNKEVTRVQGTFAHLGKPGDAHGGNAGATRHYRRARKRHNTEGHGWGDVDPEILYAACAAAINAGFLASFNPTSDGGAVHICVLHGVNRTDWYGHGGSDLNAIIVDVKQAIEHGALPVR